MSTIDEGASGGGDGTAADPLGVDPFEEGGLDVPNCPSCLHRMDAAATPAGAVFWSCPHCGQTRLA